MSDYQELIDELRILSAEGGYFAPFEKGKVADAIERLVKERDAAIADLKGIVADSEIDIDPCYYCKYVEEDGQCFHDCNPFSGKWGWEWRGATND